MKNWKKDLIMWGFFVVYVILILFVVNPVGITGLVVQDGNQGISRGYFVWLAGFTTITILIGFIGLKLRKLLFDAAIVNE